MYFALNYSHGTAERLLPLVRNMQREPAWPSLLAEHRPDTWPGRVPPTDCYQDLRYLGSEKALSPNCIQAIDSFYTFIQVCLK